MQSSFLKTHNGRDFLWDQILQLPYFRGLLRAVESRYYTQLEIPRPVLDLGCGDGHFAEATFEGRLDAGIDPWVGPIHKAIKRGVYERVIQGMGDHMPFADGEFASCISNSVLEHIPEIDAVLVETARVLKPGAVFIFCVPSHHFLNNLSVSNFFDRIGLRFVGNAYRRFFNRISRHYHCDSPEVWQERLQRAGFDLERYWHYFSPAALHTLEWGHYFGLPSLIWHGLTRRWILVPQKWNLALVNRMIRGHYEGSAEHPKGSYTFYIARKKSLV